MTETTPSGTATASVVDRTRAAAVALTAVAQFAVGSFGGAGLFGESVGAVSASYATPIVPASGAFAIWGVIYAAVLVLAVRQALPAQHARPIHRATGWWLVGAALANMAWIALFSARQVLLAEVAILALLGCLAVVLARLGAAPAENAADRWTLHGPVAFYGGWVSVATVVGTAATGRALGLPGAGPVAVGLTVVMLLVTAAIAARVITVGPAPLAFAASVVWALGGVAVAGSGLVVTAGAVLAAAAVVVTVAGRLRGAPRPPVTAFG